MINNNLSKVVMWYFLKINQTTKDFDKVDKLTSNVRS